MSHVEAHCDTPKVTRAWRRLGEGALWGCSCGVTWRLILGSVGWGETEWRWEK